ncbi:hypothetical protein FOXG_22789 [Fusarium oxysporum f. sp. lycopersici 4287]|uniref:Uncharacterized protein n=1 Tax=Fusarium oxysporum f. sp. lycopersici (strain 4287 / CBS 123668 / FGSC 9935 / NRRL 34936) TaxID=426428 RepID=A0A0J9WBR5_FUSO4|nr:hypothetical protein FOXG_22789 [Fusarium oxysporum f. sp. lycopersici 4287]KNB20263.1 hypothetical protein FOXG_22789 [Fusarium oxysporum f. sp. lycopersici 4287]
MPDHSELQRLARQFMDETGDKEPQNVEHGREQVFLCESKGREAGHNKMGDTITVFKRDGGGSRSSLSSCSEKKICSSADGYEHPRTWRKRLLTLLLRVRGSCGTFVSKIVDVELALYKTVVSSDGEESSKRVFVVFSTMPERTRR